MLIRPANVEDIDKLTELGARMHAESAYAFLAYDAEKVRRTIASYIDDPETYCVLAAQQEQSIVGMLGAYLIDYFFCDEKLACDVVVYVDAGFRGSSAATRLIRAFREWAAARGAREICLGISTGIDVERTGAFYERLGFAGAGGVYKQRL
jgi:GNAT superfamily N-acetyltransferase